MERDDVMSFQDGVIQKPLESFLRVGHERDNVLRTLMPCDETVMPVPSELGQRMRCLRDLATCG
jgi:hypothetical protein